MSDTTARDREYERKDRLRLRGLCATCGKAKALPGSCCDLCRAIARDRYRRRRDAGLPVRGIRR